MNWVAFGLFACAVTTPPTAAKQGAPPPATSAEKKVLDLAALVANPSAYEWFEFRPNLQKLILTGAADTQHVALLWYTVEDGRVGLHRHAKTEAVYVIDGAQTDAKGVYPTGTVYFNPPGSGHEITQSTGFFILAYASPPDFQNTSEIGPYEPLRIDTTATNLTGTYPFEDRGPGLQVYSMPLDPGGGMRAELLALQTPPEPHLVEANYVLVLGGDCRVDGAAAPRQTLVATSAVTPQPFEISTATSAACLALSVAFEPASP